jgi:hypothetical protein
LLRGGCEVIYNKKLTPPATPPDIRDTIGGFEPLSFGAPMVLKLEVEVQTTRMWKSDENRKIGRNRVQNVVGSRESTASVPEC